MGGAGWRSDGEGVVEGTGSGTDDGVGAGSWVAHPAMTATKRIEVFFT